jgi:ABC-type branched-subunit amino acid transport system permease subunit
MNIQKSLRGGLYIGLGTTFMAMIGMFTVFAQRFVVTGLLTLGNTLLLAVFVGAGVLAVRQTDSRDFTQRAINGAFAASVIVIILIPTILLAHQLNQLVISIDMERIFPNVTEELLNLFAFGQAQPVIGYLLLLVLAAVFGAVGALLPLLPQRVRTIALTTVMLVLILGVLEEQLNAIISLPDAIWVVLLVSLGYALAVWRNRDSLLSRLLEATGAGAIAGLILAVLLLITGATSDSMPAFLGDPAPTILASFVLGRSAVGLLVLFGIVGAGLGLTGAALSSTSGGIHRLGITIMTAILMLGVLSTATEMNLLTVIILSAILAIGQVISDRTAGQAESVFNQLKAPERRSSKIVIALAGLTFALIIPQLLTGYINNVVDLIGLYIMIGMGLNIVVGYAGLLDLGYVAFFAIGAYMTGILTTPNVITCPIPSDNVIVMNETVINEEVLDGDYTVLRGEPIGAVSGTQSIYVAEVVPRADVVQFETVELAMNALAAGEVQAVVNPQAEITPLVADAAGYTAVGPVSVAHTIWRARDFNEAEAGQWCNVLSFWAAWPLAVITSGISGLLLGIPVLRLRGDYLAIVTLGFGEIIRLVALSDLFKPYFGGAQGITSIPSPVINLTGISDALVNSGIPGITQLGASLAEPISLSQPNQIYYLILFGVLAVAFISQRLSTSRLGRSWRAMREDEDVAQAMGINLVRTKLLAFSIGAASAGIGGAIFGSYLKSIFPNSFTLLVSINVLSLIIIGGMGNIPGVMIGALVIYGLPEALREFEEYRLLMFGALLVVMMLLRPEGILPPSTPELEEKAEKALTEEGSGA